MPTTKSSPFLSHPLTEPTNTNVDGVTLSSRGIGVQASNRDAWQKLIDYQLIEWGWNTEDFDDEGIEPPTRDTIQLAIALAEGLRDNGLIAPDSVVPDANGGLVFERRENDVAEVFHVWDDGTVEYQCFHGTRLIERQPL